MQIQVTEDIAISEKKLQNIIGDPEATAKAVKLVYVNDSQEGIRRIRTGKGFKYQFRKKALKNKADLDRIKKLVIPPAWENVWICPLENGHLQVTGLDALKRKQYKYHPLWNQLRNQTKFYRLLQFGKCLPSIRKKVEADLSLPGLPCEKVLAAVVALMERTSIRIGSGLYEKMYGSFGLTTLKNRHVDVNGHQVKFSFKGKKGIEHEISIKSRKLANIVKQCREIPGKELFQFIDDKGIKQSIDSGMVNDYIRNIVEDDFTAKDFRTWSGTVQALLAFKEIGEHESVSQAKKNVIEVLDKVSRHLGNTRTVCRKYYVHPVLLDLYEKGKLGEYLDKINSKEPESDTRTGLAKEEKLLLTILEAA